MKSKRFLRNGLLALGLSACAIGLFVAGTWGFFVWRWAVWTPEPWTELLEVGDAAPDFTLRDLDGKPFHLAEEAAKLPIVLEIGSFT
jgi:hypothetical protein